MTKLLINQKIVPELLPKSTAVQLFKNVQYQPDIFANDSRNEYLNDEEFVKFVGALGLLAFKLEEDWDKKYKSNFDKISAMVKLLTL